MKTVAEWEAYWATGKAMETDQWVRAIQRDALESAAKVCETCPPFSVFGSASGGMALDSAAKRIRELAKSEDKP